MNKFEFLTHKGYIRTKKDLEKGGDGNMNLFLTHKGYIRTYFERRRKKMKRLKSF
ncbi:MAG: hypothetical protein PWP28_2700 [Oceanotoga sp.]|nr:hypothetical protein [Oceanotoga sp.]